MAAPKVSLYSLTELKTALDDHIPIYLSAANTPSAAPLPKSQRFTQSHSSTYIRLALGYTAVAIALFSFYQDYIQKLEFRDIKTYTTFAVVVYFALNGALTLWVMFGESGLVYSGSRVDGSATTSLTVKSHAPHRKYSPEYRLTASWTVSGSKAKSGSVDVKAPFTRFFDDKGFLVPAEFEAWLRREIPVLSKSAQKTGRVEEITPDGAELLDSRTRTDGAGKVTVEGAGQVIQSQRGDTIVLGGASSSADAAVATPSPKKRGRPRKDAS